MDKPDPLLCQYAAARWPVYEWNSAQVVHGAFHTVLVPPMGPILRVTVGDGFRARAEREAKIMRVLALVDLRVPTPTVLAGPVVVEHLSATLISKVPGWSRTSPPPGRAGWTPTQAFSTRSAGWIRPR